jgi:hypothetical protein
VLSREFAKDDKAVYWRGYKQSMDVSTILVNEKALPKDKDHVYY